MTVQMRNGKYQKVTGAPTRRKRIPSSLRCFPSSSRKFQETCQLKRTICERSRKGDPNFFN